MAETAAKAADSGVQQQHSASAFVPPNVDVGPYPTPLVSHRLVIWTCLLLFLVSILAAFIWTRQENDALLCHNLLEADARTLCKTLDTLSVPYKLSGSALYVPKKQLHSTRLRLAEHSSSSDGTFAIDIVDPARVHSPANGSRYVAALEDELAATISHLEGVQRAGVFIQVPGNRGRMVGEQPTAMVVLQTATEAGITPLQAQTIRNLIATTSDLLTTTQIVINATASRNGLAEFNPRNL